MCFPSTGLRNLWGSVPERESSLQVIQISTSICAEMSDYAITFCEIVAHTKQLNISNAEGSATL
jgi:hypothetical protein